MSNLSLSHAARVGAEIFDQLTDNGLPGEVGLSADLHYDAAHGMHERVTFQFYRDDYSDLRLWAGFLGAEAEVRVSKFNEAVEFCDAETVVEGVVVRLTGNRTVAAEVPA